MATEPKPRRDVDTAATVRLVILALLILYAVVFVVMNRDDVEVSFVFFTATTPLIIALVLVGLIGAVAGWLVRGQVRRRI